MRDVIPHRHGQLKWHTKCSMSTHKNWPGVEIHGHFMFNRLRQALVIHPEELIGFDITYDMEKVLGWANLGIGWPEARQRLRDLGFESYEGIHV